MKLIKTIKLNILFAIIPLILNAQNCYESTIVKPSPFMGNNGEIFKLDDGTIGEIKYEYEYMYEYSPDVIICPDTNKLIVAGKTLNIKLVSNGTQSGSTVTSMESQIDGEFKGFEGETIIKLTNGQIWQQTEYHYHYHYAYMPRVMIFKSNYGYKIQVDGIEKSIGVTRLK
jgi:hypothetical protein